MRCKGGLKEAAEGLLEAVRQVRVMVLKLLLACRRLRPVWV